MSFHSEQTVNHVIHNFSYADEAERLADTNFTDADVGKVAIQEDTLQWFLLRTSNPSWADITAVVTGGDFTGMSENAVPVNSGALIFKDSGAFVDVDNTKEWVFAKDIHVPSGSVKIGTTLSLSEGNQSLVVGQFELNRMGFTVLSPFEDGVGSAPPFYIDYGPPQFISQLDDSLIITANPLTVIQPSTVIAPDLRLLDRITLRTAAAMTNVVMRFTETNSGFVRRFVPSAAAWDGIGPGMTFGAGLDITLHFAETGTDDANNIFLGFTPFLQRPGEITEVTIKADSVSLKGDATDFPYSIREVHDGPPVELLTENYSMQDNYDSSTPPQVILDDAIGGIEIRDNAVPISDSLFSLANNAGDQDFFSVYPDRVEIGAEQIDVISKDGSGTPRTRLMDSLKVTQARFEWAEATGETQLASLVGPLEVKAETTGLLTAKTGVTVENTDSGEVVVANRIGSVEILAADTFQAKISREISAGDADINALMQLENPGVNGGNILFHTTIREPFNNISAPPGTIAYREDGSQSGQYLQNGLTTNDADWCKMSCNPPEAIEVFTDDDLNINIPGLAFTTGDVITITGDLTLYVKKQIVTSKRFVLEVGADLKITTQQVFGSSLTYTDTGTFFSGSGSVRLSEAITINSTSTGTLFELDTGTLAILNCFFNDWIDLGSFNGEFFLLRLTSFTDISTGLNLDGVFVANVFDILITSTSFTGSLFTIGTALKDSHLVFTRVLALLPSSSAILNIDPRTTFESTITVSQNVPGNGQIFQKSAIPSKVVNSVADAAVAGSITAFANAGGLGLNTTVSSALLLFDDQVVVISSTTNYNGEYRIFNVVPGVSFDIDPPFIADDATGTIDSPLIELTLLTGHGVTVGDSLGLVRSNYYNKFEVALAVTATTVLMNAIFIETDSCELNVGVGLNHSDPRVTAVDNTDFPSSTSVGGMHIERNAINTIIAVADTYQDINFTGSTGVITAAADNGLGGTTITSAGHGLNDNANVKLLNTTQYNGVFTIFNVLAGSFDINAPFIATQTGTWDAQMLLEQSSNYFRISNQVTGEIEFLGETMRGNAIMSFVSSKAGGDQTYLFTLFKNGLLVEGEPYMEREVLTEVIASTLVTSLALIKGDKIRPVVASVGTVNNILVSSMSMSIVGIN